MVSALPPWRQWIGVIALLGVAACTDEPTASAPDDAKFSAEALRASHAVAAGAEVAAAARGRKDRGFEEVILRAEHTVPGLGGVYFDGTGGVVVYLQNVANAGLVRAALARIAADAPVHPDT